MLKIAFLFLTIGDIYHEAFWQQFFAGHEQEYSIYVHSKNNLTSPFFKPHELTTKVPTSWYHTMAAQRALLKEALSDAQNYKFIFVSEACIPIQPCTTMYQILTQNNYSYLHYCPNPFSNDPERSLATIAAEHRLWCDQWVILNRKHAELIVNDTTYFENIIQYWIDNELFPATFLSLMGCLNETLNQLTTFVDWARKTADGLHPFTFTSLEHSYDRTLLKSAHDQKLLLARKFSKDCNVDVLLPLIQEHNV